MELLSKSIIFLCLTGCIVYAQDGDPDSTRCPTNMELVERCGGIGCIGITRDSFPCSTCTNRERCGDIVDECIPGDSRCGDNQVCLASGAAGRYVCTNFLGEGAACEVDFNSLDDVIDRTRDLLSGISDRDVFDDIINTVLPCQRGLVCRRVALDRRECRPEGEGPCTMDRATTDAEADCDDDGNFRPLQCRRIPETERYRCRCVEPSGDVVPDSQRDVDDPREAPDCDDIINDRCQYVSRLGQTFEVRSGLTFVDPESCRRCLCDDGELTLCETAREDCSVIDPEPREDQTCRLRGRTIENGDSVEVGCNRCGCRNGELFCTRRDCDDDDDEEEDDEEDDVGEDPDDSEEDRNCRRCASMRANPVCGSDGKTYPSSCFATNCRGLSSTNIVPGPCSRRNICDTFPCEDDEFCLRAGGVTCLSSAGCPERLRRCVDLEQLRCRGRDDDGDGDDDEEEDSGDGSGDGSGEETPDDEESRSSDDDDEEDGERVCGDNRRTYPSICTLLQNSAGIQVAYAGRCNRTECEGGPVCGTDGETYDNICELQTNSANARVDYRGECMDSDDIIGEKCQRLRASGRCPDLSGCTSRVRPADGCCPICGGSIVIRLVREILDEFIRLNPEFERLDDFIKALIADGFIPENILRTCRLAANLLDTGELHLVMENMDSAGSVCRDFLERIADKINNPDTTGTTAIPQLLQSATVAETASLIEEDVSGAVKLLPLTLVLMLLPLLALFL